MKGDGGLPPVVFAGMDPELELNPTGEPSEEVPLGDEVGTPTIVPDGESTPLDSTTLVLKEPLPWFERR